MKYLKVIVPLLVVVALLVMALPAGAQGPRPVFVRAAGTNEDPFGGFPILTSSGKGAATLFGVGGPGVFALPGGVPSDKSGDGTSARKAIYIGGAWANSIFTGYGQGNPVGGGGGWSPFTRAANENPMEIPSCATVKIPAGTSRWFKTDSWVRSQGSAGSQQNLKLQVWLDDELNTATAPSGSATWGAADNYMWGANNESFWVQNGWDIYPWSQGTANGGPLVDGYVMAIYDPDNMKPNYAFAPPNATLYTLGFSGTGSPRRSCQAPGCDNGRGLSGTGIIYPGPAGSFIPGAGLNFHGLGEFNPNQPSHLLWWEGVMDGWVHVRVYNQMIWDGVATVCSYRANR